MIIEERIKNMEELFRRYLEFDKRFDGLFDYQLLIKAGMKESSDYYKIDNWYSKNKDIVEIILKEFNINIKSNLKENVKKLKNTAFKEKEPTIESFKYYGMVHEY